MGMLSIPHSSSVYHIRLLVYALGRTHNKKIRGIRIGIALPEILYAGVPPDMVPFFKVRQNAPSQ